ncbi:unnamed protein product [Parajaminaea phylloscopi]
MAPSRTSTQHSAKTQVKEETLPKHPTNKKPYPHSPPGVVTTTDGDVIQLTYESLDIEKAAKEVQSRWAGATALFMGSTREDWADLPGGDTDKGHLRVTRLEYECYTPLALKTMRAIVKKARETSTQAWPPADLTPHEVERLDAISESQHSAVELQVNAGKTGGGSTLSKRNSRKIGEKEIRKSMALHEPDRPPTSPDAILHIHISHRLGPVPTGSPSILLAVSSPHRRRAFEVSEWLLEEIKRSVPIWKREVREAVSSESGKDGDRRKSDEKAQAALDIGGSEWVGLNERKPNKVSTAPAVSNGSASTNGNGGSALTKIVSGDREDVFTDAALAPSLSRHQ